MEETRLATFDRKILIRIYRSCIDFNTGELRIRRNEEWKNLFQKPDIIAEITKNRFIWANGHAWRKEGSFIKEDPAEKGPLGRSHLRLTRKGSYQKTVEPNIHWRLKRSCRAGVNQSIAR